jgi:hypothetical protein
MEKHRELCLLGAKYMKLHGLMIFQKPAYVVCELERANAECPDVFGFGSALTQLIEVKVSRADFFADRNKPFRKNPEKGLGQLRSYLCPAGIIGKLEVPDKWGLLYYDEGEIISIQQPSIQVSDTMQEMNLAASILRREGVASKILSYKKI